MCSFPSELQLSEALLMGWQWGGKQMLLSVQLLLILQERGSTALRAQRWAAWCSGTRDTNGLGPCELGSAGPALLCFSPGGPAE